MNIYTKEEYTAKRKKDKKFVCGQQYIVNCKDAQQQPYVLTLYVMNSKSAHIQVRARAKELLPATYKIISVVYA